MIAALIVVAGLGLTGCGSSASPAPSTSPGSASASAATEGSAYLAIACPLNAALTILRSASAAGDLRAIQKAATEYATELRNAAAAVKSQTWSPAVATAANQVAVEIQATVAQAELIAQAKTVSAATAAYKAMLDTPHPGAQQIRTALQGDRASSVDCPSAS